MRELRILRVHGDHPMLFSRHGNLPNPRQQARFFHLWRNIRRPRHTHVAASPPRKARQHRIRLRPYRDRLDEQRAYFGITREQAVAIAHESAAFTSKRLAAPFTVLTRWRSALGRSALGRVLHRHHRRGPRLERAACRERLARSYGVRTTLPDGRDSQKNLARLAELEAQAKKAKRGAWRFPK